MRTRAEDVKGLGRVVRGQVSASGGVVSGSGFSVVHSGTGVYVVTPLPPFKSPPDVSVDAAAGGIAGASLNGAPTPSSFGVLTVAAGYAALADEPFSFIAIEGNPA